MDGLGDGSMYINNYNTVKAGCEKIFNLYKLLFHSKIDKK